MKRKRLRADVRKDELITEALSMAASDHYTNVTRNGLAEAAGVSGSTVQYHFATMDKMRNEIMRAAVKRGDLVVLAQGIMAKHAHALRAPEGLRHAAVMKAAGA